MLPAIMAGMIALVIGLARKKGFKKSFKTSCVVGVVAFLAQIAAYSIYFSIQGLPS